MNPYIAYNVHTRTSSDLFKSPETLVVRRYRDFLLLTSILEKRYPGVIVPPVPEKSALGK